MAKLTMTTFVTLDGVMQAPGAPDEDRSGGFPHGGWLVPFAERVVELARSTDEDIGLRVVLLGGDLRLKVTGSSER